MTYAVTPLLALWLLWYLYLIVIGLYRAKLQGRLGRTALFLGAPALIIGWLLDWLVNWTIAALWFWEFPKQPMELVTGRLSRYIAEPEYSFRKHCAAIICGHLLDVFDPSPYGHCKGVK